MQHEKYILAIDPGTTTTGYAMIEVDDGRVLDAGVTDNTTMLRRLEVLPPSVAVASEMIACYGMAVGASIFETCVWIGQFKQAVTVMSRAPWSIVYRRDAKMHLCGQVRAKDPNVRQAIIDLYGGVQETKKGGKLYGVKSHAWAAMAVALVAQHRAKGGV